MERTRRVTKTIVIPPQIAEDVITPAVPADVELVRKPIRWKKVGGGTFLWNNHFIKQNQVFLAYPEDIPKQFRDLVVPLEEIVEPLAILQKVEIDNSIIYTLEEESGKWNIIDSQGKKLNERLLTLEEANRILKAL